MKKQELCKLYRQIRKDIAADNGIDLPSFICSKSQKCSENCPQVKEEIAYLEKELYNKIKDGKELSLNGLTIESKLAERLTADVTGEKTKRKAKRRMVDVHAHVLFGIDDGAKSYEMSKEMLTSLYDQGVTDVICTSHSWGHLDKYASHFKQLSEVYDERPIGLYPGCEIEAYSPEDIPDVLERLLYRKEISTLNETDYILLEFLPNDSYEDIIKATHIFHVHAPNKVIILAHVERYIDLYRHREALERLEGMGCLFQINAHSLVDESKFETKNFARWLLHSRKVSFLGSDAHRMDHRPPNVASGIEYIFDHYPEEYAKDVCYRNAEKFLLRKI